MSSRKSEKLTKFFTRIYNTIHVQASAVIISIMLVCEVFAALSSAGVEAGLVVVASVSSAVSSVVVGMSIDVSESLFVLEVDGMVVISG